MLFPQLTIESRPGLLCFILGITSVSKYLAFSPCNNLKKNVITQLDKALDILEEKSSKYQAFGTLNVVTTFRYFLILLLINSLLILYICQKWAGESEFVVI